MDTPALIPISYEELYEEEEDKMAPKNNIVDSSYNVVSNSESKDQEDKNIFEQEVKDKP